jgi:hypothetical protein
MTTLALHVGATVNRAPRAGYFAELPFVELAFRNPLPRIGRLREWRESVPASARIALVIPRVVVNQPRGALRFDDTASLDWLLAAQEATRADTFVLETHAELTPSARDQEMLKKFAARITRGGTKLVWEAGGVWEQESASALAQAHGWTVTWDPTGDELAPPGGVYVRVHALGARSRLSEGLLASIADGVLAAAVRTGGATIAIDGEQGYRKAKTLVAIFSGETVDEGGMGAPRRSASDDEEDFEDEDDSDE